MQIKEAGFNTVVLDVKPIPGFTLYPSAYAPKMTEWKGETLPADFDPLAELLNAGHAAGLSVIANMNVFCEGHRWLNKGPGFAHPEWQATLLEPEPVLANTVEQKRLLAIKSGTTTLPPDVISVATSAGDLPRDPGAVVVVADASRKVVAEMLGTEVSASLPVPRGEASWPRTARRANSCEPWPRWARR